MEWIVLVSALLLALVNGANDNFKGVATLYGSGALSYRKAVAVATLSTALGSLLSLSLAAGLIRAFSGKGIVPDALLDTHVLAAVGAAAVVTVLLATRLGIPVSTTHALVGGIGGAGLVAAGSQLQLSTLGWAFCLPLLAGPVLAVGLAWLGLRAAAWLGSRFEVPPDGCICVGRELGGAASSFGPVHALGPPAASAAAMTMATGPFALSREPLAVRRGHSPDCESAMAPGAAAITRAHVVGWSHLMSASAVGFARGLNDTPKILGLLLGASVLTPAVGTLAITVAMALGGLLFARRVAETLAHRITPMSPEQGLVGNLATSALVIFASRLGVPVSTTHVSGGAIFGIGSAHESLDGSVVKQILAAWLTTLPLAVLLGASFMWAQSWL